MVNVNDFEAPDEVPENIWPMIFKKQMQLAAKYKDIENMGTLLETTETNVDTANGQMWIKDFAWRVTEELTESYEAYWECEMHATDGDIETAKVAALHSEEELIDAVHFLAELTIIAGKTSAIIDPKAIGVHEPTVSEVYLDVVYRLGLMCNCLKNKPWKQSQMLTDRIKFNAYLKQSWAALLNLLKYFDLDDAAIYKLYFKKNQVNRFRQRSKY